MAGSSSSPSVGGRTAGAARGDGTLRPRREGDPLPACVSTVIPGGRCCCCCCCCCPGGLLPLLPAWSSLSGEGAPRMGGSVPALPFILHKENAARLVSCIQHMPNSRLIRSCVSSMPHTTQDAHQPCGRCSAAAGSQVCCPLFLKAGARAACSCPVHSPMAWDPLPSSQPTAKPRPPPLTCRRRLLLPAGPRPPGCQTSAANGQTPAPGLAVPAQGWARTCTRLWPP